MKKMFPSLFILILFSSIFLFFGNGMTEQKQTPGTCDQQFCAKSGAAGAIIKVYDSGNNLVGTCTTDLTGCCPSPIKLIIGQTYTAYYSNSTCAKNSITFSACTMIVVQVPGCP